MSVYRQQQTQMTDLGVIADCLREMPQPKTGIVRGPRQGNFAPVLHPQKVQLTGFAGDKREQTAQLVIPREQCSSNDVGFEQDGPGKPVQIHISNADKSCHFNDKWLADLKVRYAERHSRKIAAAAGYKQIRRVELPNGKLRLQYAKA